MSKIPVCNKFKSCANCVYWAGNRIPEPFFHRFLVDQSEKGKCCNRKSYYNLNMPMNGTCHHFETHTIVKE